jgi:HlyD family secretion protein
MQAYARGALAPTLPLRRPVSAPVFLQPRPGEPRPRNPWPWLAFALVLLVQFWPQERPAPVLPAIPVTTGRTSVEESIRVAGVTSPQKYVTLLAPQLIGTRQRSGGFADFLLVLQKLAQPGSLVKKGDIVAEFDVQYMLNRLDDYRSSVIQHEANLKKLRALLEVKRKQYEQIVRAAKGRMDKAALDLKKAPVLSAIKNERNRLVFEEETARYAQLVNEARYMEISERAAIRRSELDLQVSQLELRRAQASLEKMQVKAPIDGFVVMQSIWRGAEYGQLQAGDQLYPGQPYVRIVDCRSMVVQSNVNQVDVEQLRIGMPARVRFDAYPGLELPARIISIGSFAASSGWRASYVRAVPVRFKLEKMDPRVLPDLSVSAELILKHR